MKKKLLALMAKKNERKLAIVTKSEKTEDITELRSLNTEIDIINTEIRELQEMIDALPEDDDPNFRTAVINSSIPGVVTAGTETRSTDYEGMEYRQAFMQYVTRGVDMPAELRDDEVTKTSDIGYAIPPVVVNKIIEKMESIGMILPLVTKTFYPAGMSLPTSSVKPVATFVGEGESSDKQKKTISGKISFTHFKLRCEIAITMEASVMAISAFETLFTKQVAEAMVKAKEAKIVSDANGTTSMKGILAETPETGQALTAKELSYELLVKAEAALPQQYESGAVWCMTKMTFMSFVGMTDANGQPIARTNYGIGGKPERTLLGRSVVLCGDYMYSFSSSLQAGKTFAFIFDFADYVLNSNYNMGIQRKQDWDTEDLLTKAVEAVDGKVVDKGSLVTIKKAA